MGFHPRSPLRLVSDTVLAGVLAGALASLAALPACSDDETGTTVGTLPGNDAGTGGGDAGGGGTTGGGDSGSAAVDPKTVVADYAALVRASYADTLTLAGALKTAVDAFVAAPSEATLGAARAAWKAARPAYGQTEAFRFYGGPIDADDTGLEGEINAWPIDENFIDYVQDPGNAGGVISGGIVNDAAAFPSITKEIVKGENENGGEKNISAGWHAIEFLLWGQDFDAAGPGKRPFTDYTTAANAERRGAYLKLATELLVNDLTEVAAAWDPANAQSYGSAFVAGDATASLTKILNGIGSLATSELPRERMQNAYDTKEQEEEHSCFSDTTHFDLRDNLLGVQNVYLGKYGTFAGKGVDALVAAKDPALDQKMKARLTTALASIAAIPAPFDQAILGATDEAPGRVAVKKAIDDVKAVGATVAEIAAALGLTINVEE